MSYMSDTSKSRSLWELVVLAFLRERSMHPYEMQRLLRERHKDDLLVLKRGSLYHAIRRLEAEGVKRIIITTDEPERYERVLRMVDAMEEYFGSCTMFRECEAVCPKEISVDFIARMNRDYIKGSWVQRGDTFRDDGA